ncbi:hypothetical protein PM082_024313 [Marasmius tenuissimus]|nr:hypothetical protein PM082_024313 [Marasmius tenuissimus]
MDAQRLANNHDELFEMIRTHIGPNRDLEFGKVLCLGLWSPNIRMVDKFGVGRVFIGGDAAHVHSPTGGQGLNTGVQDAFNLGWKLSLVHKKLAPASLLESYNDERLPVVAVMLKKTTLLMDKTFAENSDITSHWKREFEMRQLGVNYRGSKLVVDEKYGREEGEGDEKVDPYRGGLDGKAKGGDRAPAAESLVVLKGFEGTDASETCLYDLLSSAKHTAVVFAKENEEEKEMEMLLSTVKKLFPQDTVQTVVLRSQPKR